MERRRGRWDGPGTCRAAEAGAADDRNARPACTVRRAGGWLTAGVVGALALPDPAAGATMQERAAEALAAPPASLPSGAPARLQLRAVPVLDEEIRIDGRGDEPAWQTAEVATGFVQFEPDEGAAASERTEARVLYGARAVYVLMRAWDRDADAVVGQLTRRDQASHSDRLGVVFDSYFDRRTAFHFAVNPRGVKTDVYHFDDTAEDPAWDAVWDVATSVDEEGWTAEFRIPYSQLRFRDGGNPIWGVNFVRRIARRQETSLWAPTTRSASAIVSRFGELHGLENLDVPARLEVLPYSLARLERAPGEAGDPFHRPTHTGGTVGADVKYGVTSDLTLDLTLNPDFGQVEADPGQVNLSAFETFLPERRPFFVEGSSIFRFSLALGDGDGAVESLFYSRRIGRAPQGEIDDDDAFVDAADRTTILGAWKLSGKTAAGWSIGALHALTSEERARVAPDGATAYDEPVEPLTSYGVLRIQKDFREGRSAIGLIGTGTLRDGDVADRIGLRSRAFAGGVDLRHRFAGERWELSGYLLGSRVEGSAEAIDDTQRSAARYFQRPDADHVTYDSTRTSLSGISANLGISKISGGPWRFGTGLQTRTPGFEVNDLGFLNNADFVTHWAWLGYQRTAPQGPFLRWGLNWNGWNTWTHGGERTSLGGNVNGNFQLRSFWSGWGGIEHQLEVLDPGMLRGGPAMRREAQTNFWGGLGTDDRKAIQLNVNGSGNVRPASDSWTLRVSPSARIRPSGRATFHVGTSVTRNVDDRQWVRRIEAGTPHYLFARLDQTTVGLTTRVDYAFTPTLSLQLYVEPFVSAGSYDGFKRASDPRGARYEDRFEAVEVRRDGDRYRVDLDGDGTEESFGPPDFDVRRFRSNAVLRWEYRPGSSLFLVWSQGRDDSGEDGVFDFRRDLGDLFGARPTNVFMVKMSYWFGR